MAKKKRRRSKKRATGTLIPGPEYDSVVGELCLITKEFEAYLRGRYDGSLAATIAFGELEPELKRVLHDFPDFQRRFGLLEDKLKPIRDRGHAERVVALAEGCDSMAETCDPLPPHYWQKLSSTKIGIYKALRRGNPQRKELACILKKSENTLKRPIQQLKQEGLIANTRGLGYYLTDDPRNTA